MSSDQRLDGAFRELQQSLQGFGGAVDQSLGDHRTLNPREKRLRFLARLLKALAGDIETVVADVRTEGPKLPTRKRQRGQRREYGRQRPEYVAGEPVAEFVARGIDASDNIANEKAPRPDFLAALKNALPKEEISQEELRKQIGDRFTRLLRAVASEVRDSRREERVISEGDTWSTDLQFEIVDQFPIRPDETTPFLHALLFDVVAAVAADKNLGGDWGELAIDGGDKLIMRLNAGWRRNPPAENRRGTQFTTL
jgi:hypothetical protein